MTFNEDASLDTSQVSDQRGSFGGVPGGGFTVGGGGLGIVGLILYLIINGLSGGGAGTTPDTGPNRAVTAQDLAGECRTGADANARTDCRIVGYVNSVQSYWRQEFQQSGRRYRVVDTVLFTGGTRTGCGEQDITDGLDAAAAVGDDRIQERTQGRVDPESWTHGSAEQRQRWFREGFSSGEPGSCDTFSASI